MRTLDELIEYLENSIDRAESDDWTALCLNVAEAKELLSGLKNESSTFLQPKTDSDRQPKWDITPPKDNQFKCQNCGQIHELGPYKLVKSQAEDVTESMTNTLSNTTPYLNDEPFTAEPPDEEGWYWIDEGGRYCIVYVGQDPFEKPCPWSRRANRTCSGAI